MFGRRVCRGHVLQHILGGVGPAAWVLLGVRGVVVEVVLARHLLGPILGDAIQLGHGLQRRKTVLLTELVRGVDQLALDL